jgi:hypothetical protein
MNGVLLWSYDQSKTVSQVWGSKLFHQNHQVHQQLPLIFPIMEPS